MLLEYNNVIFEVESSSRKIQFEINGNHVDKCFIMKTDTLNYLKLYHLPLPLLLEFKDNQES
jgi:hypothetical protein